MDLNEAIQKHAAWKLKFRSAIAGQEAMDADTIAKDNCCDLGKWLHGEAKAKFASLASHADCVSRHAHFHAEAAKVAKTINARRFDQAEAMLGSGTGYSLASNAVGVAIIGLQRDARL